MGKLLLIGIIGFGAQLIDGALGTAYGVSSTTLLLAIGSAPAVASATVHLAEVGTVAVSAASHTRFGNVEWRTVRLMSLPGFVGAFLGAVALSSLSAEKAEPFMAGFLFLLGVYVLVRFSFRRHVEDSWVGAKPLPWYALVPLGGFAGFMDAAGGGGWGPIGAPALLGSRRMEPRKVVGSVDPASSSSRSGPRWASSSRSGASRSSSRGSRRCWPAAWSRRCRRSPPSSPTPRSA